MVLPHYWEVVQRGGGTGPPSDWSPQPRKRDPGAVIGFRAGLFFKLFPWCGFWLRFCKFLEAFLEVTFDDFRFPSQTIIDFSSDVHRFLDGFRRPKYLKMSISCWRGAHSKRLFRFGHDFGSKSALKEHPK